MVQGLCAYMGRGWSSTCKHRAKQHLTSLLCTTASAFAAVGVTAVEGIVLRRISQHCSGLPSALFTSVYRRELRQQLLRLPLLLEFSPVGKPHQNI